MISGEHKTSNGSDDSGNTDNASESDSDTYRSASRRSSLNSEPDASPLIRPGEGIVLDFSEETYDALFGGRAGDGEPHGTLAISEAELITYPDITKARALRKRRASSGIPLEDCIDAFKKEEKLSEANAWHCPRCKENRRAKKKFDLWTSPDILVIHLKRFSSTGVQSSKLKDLVSFPITGLDLTGSVAAPEEGKSLVYDLFAVDDHTGGTWGGHYTAAAKSFMDDRWYEYNGM